MLMTPISSTPFSSMRINARKRRRYGPASIHACMLALVTAVHNTIMSELRLPSYFPRSHKSCSRPSDTFFECLYTKSQKKDASDKEAGERGLLACKKEMEAYKYCMERYGNSAKIDGKKYRVQAEYRAKEDSSAAK